MYKELISFISQTLISCKMYYELDFGRVRKYTCSAMATMFGQFMNFYFQLLFKLIDNIVWYTCRFQLDCLFPPCLSVHVWGVSLELEWSK